MERKSLNNILWFASGANIKVLEQSPLEHVKYEGIGLAIILTALLSSFSATYAFSLMFGSSFYLIFFALFWGVLIFNIDRSIVSNMNYQSLGKETLMASIRILLALIIGVSIAKPLELKFFESDIELRMLKDTSEYSAKIDSIFENQRQEISSLKNDNELLLKKLDEKEKGVLSLEKIAIEEAEGTSGTGKQGTGKIWQLKNSQAVKERRNFKKIEKNISKEVEKNNGRIQSIQENIDKAIVANVKKKSETDGLLARITAYSAMAEENSAVWWTGFLITLLIIALEISPVLIKLLAPRGSYDYLYERLEMVVNLENKLAVKEMKAHSSAEEKIYIDDAETKVKIESKKNKEIAKYINENSGNVVKASFSHWEVSEVNNSSINAMKYIKGNLPKPPYHGVSSFQTEKIDSIENKTSEDDEVKIIDTKKPIEKI